MMPVISEPVVRSFILYSGILGLKILCMTILTGYKRLTKKVYANEEDAKMLSGVIKFDDPDVERSRRAHLNDLENIPVFWILGASYLTTGPDPDIAINLFRVYTACRIFHTIVYAIIPLPQPTRGLAFDISYLINLFMGGAVLVYYCSDL